LMTLLFHIIGKFRHTLETKHDDNSKTRPYQ